MLSLTLVDISYNQLEGPLPNIKAFQEVPFEALRGNTSLQACSLNKTVGKNGNEAIVWILLPFFVILFIFCVVVCSYVFYSK
ncbi:hypothetical protein CsSME_00014527 [Camellia sinensis var. sinensis]